jgi:hypothetical protein
MLPVILLRSEAWVLLLGMRKVMVSVLQKGECRHGFCRKFNREISHMLYRVVMKVGLYSFPGNGCMRHSLEEGGP